MLVINVTEKSTGKSIPAEIRQYTPNDKMLALIKDFDTAKMIAIVFNWNAEIATWISANSLYETTYTMPPTADVTVKVYKKKTT